MYIEPASLDSLHETFSAAFASGLSEAPMSYEQFTMTVPSNNASQKYPFLEHDLVLRKWLGERVFKNLHAHDYTLVNEEYEGTLSVLRKDVDDDNLGMANIAAKGLGKAARRWPHQLVMIALANGGTATCYDGQFFFDTDHPVNKYDAAAGTQSNLFTSTALTETTYATTRAAMQRLKGADGEELYVIPNVLLVPTALEKTARTIVAADHISQSGGSTQTNVYKGSAEVVVDPRLDRDSATTWYLLDTTNDLKPFIFQERIAPEFNMEFNPNSTEVFKTKKFTWGAYARGAAGYGMWQLAAKCTA